MARGSYKARIGNGSPILKPSGRRRKRAGFSLAKAEASRWRKNPVRCECGRARLQCSIALLFCRQFLVSEEWLATGAHEALHAVAKEKGLPGTEIFEQEPEFFFRQCVDLHSECAAQGIAIRGSLGEVYPRLLAPISRRLASQFFHEPLVSFRDTDSPKLVQNYLNVLLARWLRLLDNESAAREVSPGLVRRTMLRCLFEVGTIIFTRMIGRATPQVAASPEYAWLRALVESPDTPIGPLHGRNAQAGQGSEKMDLTEKAVKLDTVAVQSAMPKLLERLRKATADGGSRRDLARHRVRRILADSNSAVATNRRNRHFELRSSRRDRKFLFE